jgi:hypothetical protein
MKTVSFAIALLALVASPALTPGSVAHATSIHCSGMDAYVHWADRSDPDDARVAITTEDGDVTLLLTERDVVMQLSDQTLRRVRRELRDAEDDQDNVLASAIVTAVTATVREVLSHSLLCHVRDLSDVSYEDGRLVFTGRNGRAVFGHVSVSDSDVTREFSEKDARKFVREFRRLKAGD